MEQVAKDCYRDKISFDMSSSFVDYRKRGFWSFDPYLEDTLYCLAQGVDLNSPPWMLDAKAYWSEQATGGFMGFVSSNLDELLTSEGASPSLRSQPRRLRELI